MTTHHSIYSALCSASMALLLGSLSTAVEAQEISVLQPEPLSTLTKIRIVSTDQPSDIQISRIGGWRDRRLEIEIKEMWTHETTRRVIPVRGSVVLEVVLSPFDDTLTNNSEYGASIYAGRGNDLIYCGWGDDLVYLSEGDDAVDLGSGDDVAYGGTGDDAFLGGNGDDYIRGSSGNDWIWAEAGNDEIHGGDGYDELNGGDGHDYLAGGRQGDYLRGAQGFDTLIADSEDILLDWPPFINMVIFLGGKLVTSGEYAFDYVALYSDNP